MKKIVLVALVFAAGTGSMAAAADLEQRAQGSRATVRAFMGALKGELMKAMQAGGPVEAVKACRVKAPAIAREQSEKTGWRVGRTSLKVRNPANAPDAWERKVLESFEARKAAGEDVKKMEHYEVVEMDGRKVFRYMKAIPTGALCLTCHGADLAPGLAAELDRLYPKDEARGFKAGDIRGAFTIVQPM